MALRLTPARRRPSRRLWVALLAAAVTLLHLAAVRMVADSLAGFGDARKVPQRMQAAFVRELKPEPPPSAAPVPPVRRAKAGVRKRRPAESSLAAAAASPVAAASEPASAPPSTLATGDDEAMASAPDAAASAPAMQSAVAASAALAQVPSAAEPAASAVGSSHQAASAVAPPSEGAPTAFEWPASTRLSYTLSGYYRGTVHGSAQVQWVHRGDRYQVQMDVTIGPDFAPLMARRIVSDGVVSGEGLAPRRFDEETSRAFGESRRYTVTFERGEVVLANGQRRVAPPGVQDAASQFVQLTWLFTTEPQRLKPGNTVEIPLALPRSLDRWLYDVIGEATLYPPFGELQAIHLKPRREARPGGDLVAEMWIAPALQYLPVRILVRQDAETFVDLMIDRPPLQAEREATTPAAR